MVADKLLKILCANAILPAKSFHVIIPLYLIFKCEALPGRLIHKFGFFLGIVHIVIPLEYINLIKKTILGAVNPFLELLCRQLLYKLIRVLVRLHADDPDCDARLLQHRYCPQRRLNPCPIAVITEIHRIRIPLEQTGLLARKCCSQGSDGIRKPCLVKGDYIHIPLAYYNPMTQLSMHKI